MVADKCLELWERYKPKSDEEYGALVYRVNAVKGLVELTRGNLESGTAKAFAIWCFIVSIFFFLGYMIFA